MVELTAPPGDRFVVREIAGYGLGNVKAPTTSYSVYDLDYCCVVATFYSPSRGGLTNAAGQFRAGEREERRRSAEAKCRALNEQHRRWLHSGRWT